MSAFLISAMIVIVLVICIWLVDKAMDGNRNAIAALCLFIFLLLGLVINHTTKIESKGPCHEYKTEMMYNSATKTMVCSTW